MILGSNQTLLNIVHLPDIGLGHFCCMMICFPKWMPLFNFLNLFSVCLQMSIGIRKAQKWWEKGVQPNMKEVNSAQELVDSLLSAGDKLVVVDFFSPGCGGCKALHPKVKKNSFSLFKNVFECQYKICKLYLY